MAYKTKTFETSNSVLRFIESVQQEQKRKDALVLLGIMQKLSGYEPKMWGPSIIGFGSYHYKYATGHEGDAPLIGFSPRKAAFSLYLSCDFQGRSSLLKQFGKHKVGKACIYFNKMSDINIPVLEKMIAGSLSHHGFNG